MTDGMTALNDASASLDKALDICNDILSTPENGATMPAYDAVYLRQWAVDLAVRVDGGSGAGCVVETAQKLLDFVMAKPAA